MRDPQYKHQFIYRGQSRTLFKRRQAPQAPWYVKIVRAHKTIVRTLRATNATEAERAAKTVIDAADKGNWEDVAPRKLLANAAGASGPAKFQSQHLMAEDCLKQAVSWLKTGRQRAEVPGGDPEHVSDALDAALLHTQAACRHLQALKDLLRKPV